MFKTIKDVCFVIVCNSNNEQHDDTRLKRQYSIPSGMYLPSGFSILDGNNLFSTKHP